MIPILSFIIPTWNTSKITLKCIRTIRRFFPTATAEIIIVDNGSTDDTQKVFSRLSNIIYIRNQTNLGFSKGNNVGARRATGKYYIFLNSDMELLDGGFEQIANYLDHHPQVGLAGPRFLNPDLTPQGSISPPQTPFNAFRQYWLRIPGSYEKAFRAGQNPSPVWAISGGALVISAKLFHQINGWDERYFFYYEDLEMCRQVRNLGYQIIYYPKCQVVHRHGASGHKLASTDNQWRRLIPSSIKYHGVFIHYLIFIIIWSSQKWYRLFCPKHLS